MIVYGDHGEAFEQHPGNAGHTFFIYDENVRVPLMIAVPGATPRQVRVPAVTSLVDVVPTMLDLLGLPPSAEHQGVSALQAGLASCAVLHGLLTRLARACATAAASTCTRSDPARSKLFDICRDPEETIDLSAARSGPRLADIA